MLVPNIWDSCNLKCNAVFEWHSKYYTGSDTTVGTFAGGRVQCRESMETGGGGEDWGQLVNGNKDKSGHIKLTWNFTFQNQLNITLV